MFFQGFLVNYSKYAVYLFEVGLICQFQVVQDSFTPEKSFRHIPCSGRLSKPFTSLTYLIQYIKYSLFVLYV